MISAMVCMVGLGMSGCANKTAKEQPAKETTAAETEKKTEAKTEAETDVRTEAAEVMTEAADAAAEAAEAVTEAADAAAEAAEAVTEAADAAVEAAEAVTETAAAETESLAADTEAVFADFAEEAESETEEGYEYEDIFADWNEDAPALQTLIDYVEAVTDEESPDYIPPEDRIATFDMDGTLYGELFPTYLEYYMLAWRILKDPSIEPDDEMLAVGRELRDSVISHEFAEDLPIRHAIQAARAYAGMTVDEFAAFVNEILIRDVDGFTGMTYAEAFYSPMIEVIEYLYDNEFKVFVCSGSDRFICRTLFEGIAEVPDENIIGMDVAMVASGQNGEDGLNYVFTKDDKVIRSDQLLIKNLKMNKVSQITRDIGKQPVLSFGNSSGDVSMHNFTISNNPYRSAAFMLIADDEERDYGNTQKCVELRKTWEENGYNVISMKDDFRTIYGDDVVKTDSFRWAEELADEEEGITEELSESIAE